MHVLLIKCALVWASCTQDISKIFVVMPTVDKSLEKHRFLAKESKHDRCKQLPMALYRNNYVLIYFPIIL